MLILKGFEARVYMFLKGVYEVGAAIVFFFMEEWDHTIDVFLLAVCTLILLLSLIFEQDFGTFISIILVIACLTNLFNSIIKGDG
jgi:cell division protein FtsW (lipid II flippase)